jgi:hypothetical protein
MYLLIKNNSFFKFRTNFYRVFVLSDGGYETVPEAAASAAASRQDPSTVCSPPRNELGYEQVLSG